MQRRSLSIFLFLFPFRFVIAKRCFFILSILYLYRSICFYVTVLPISSSTYYCSPKSESSSIGEIVRRAFQVVLGMGLSINNKQIICGDSIFSGHATILIFCCLIISECKSPAAFTFITSIVFLFCSHRLT
jgi:shingomyelin synthase